MNKRKQIRIEKLLFKIYENGVQGIECDLTTYAKKIEEALIIDSVSKSF
jgi:hypothetical protein